MDQFRGEIWRAANRKTYKCKTNAVAHPNVFMMFPRAVILVFLFIGTISLVWSKPIPYREELAPRSVVSDLNARLASRAPRRQVQDPRLPIPTPQDLEAIKKVAQILVMLGEQVIPAIIGEPQTGDHNAPSATNIVDVPNDVVNDKPLTI